MQITFEKLPDVLTNNNVKRIFVVGSKRAAEPVIEQLEKYNKEHTLFSAFQVNPTYDDIVTGVHLFNNKNCDFIISIGGGSTIDTAKCIKLFSSLDSKKSFLEQEYKQNNIKHLCIPTTAGTGSEATSFSVIYYKGEKQSIKHDSKIPDYIILEPELLKTLGDYQKKATLLDALCQSIESFWSVNSTTESKTFAEKSIKLVLDNIPSYFAGEDNALKNMLAAANYSGKAINITTTTAPHAMSYKLTSLYGIAHGHAVALCLPYVWEYMIKNSTKEHKSFGELNSLFNTEKSIESVKKFRDILSSFDLPKPIMRNENELEILVNSVNTDRLKNTPVSLDKKAIREIYQNIFNGRVS